MHSPLPLTKDVVLIGGGHSHALVLRRWGMNPLAGARLTLINPGPTAPYSGMLPGYIAGHYGRRDLEIDLVRLARFANARLVLARAVGLDRVRQQVLVAGQAPISYDIASINVGITTEIPAIPGFVEHALGAKPLARYAARWAEFLEAVAAQDLQANVAIIGGGVAGVELSLAMMFHLAKLGAKNPHVTVFEAAETPLPGIGAGARRALLGHMARLGVTLKTDVRVVRIHANEVELADGSRVATNFCVGTASARPHPWLAETGLANEAGFLPVDATLHSTADPLIYAAGDCAEMTRSPRPKAGVFAVREAPVLYHNLRAELTDAKRRAFHPQKSYLKLISTGGKGAVADKLGLRLDGALLWRWKDHIDRKFMRKFADYPEMDVPPLPKDATRELRIELGKAPLCGGCGAKVGSADLSTVLADLPHPKRADVLSRPGDDAAILAHGDERQVFTTDHLRAFVSDPYRMARIAAVHAMGDIWAMGARPQAALTSIILPRMSTRMQAETLREIMAAASETFAAAGAEIVGGHTSLGAELTIGYAMTGLASGPVIENSGARVGDVLILTKPLGIGTILAAEMRLQARGEWVADAYKTMELSQEKAADILAPIAHAMTDVTGFGLAGHLQEMALKSGVQARLDLASLPFLDGAGSLAMTGIRSSLWEANRAAVALSGEMRTPAEILLFDPQTAGGLLAAVPKKQVKRCLQDFEKAGKDAFVIGEITPGPAGISLA